MHKTTSILQSWDFGCASVTRNAALRVLLLDCSKTSLHGVSGYSKTSLYGVSGYSLVSHINPHTFHLTWKRLAVKSSCPSSSVFHDILPAADASAPNVTAILIGRPLRVCVVNVSLSVALCQHSVLTAAQQFELTIHSNSRTASRYPDTPHLRAGARQKGGLWSGVDIMLVISYYP
jgi:hypothetical protein